VSNEPLASLLGQLNAFPGVVGSMVCDDQGKVLAEGFPPQVDPGASARAAKVLAEHAGGLGAVGGPVSMFSIRFGGARMLVRPIGTAHLLVLCSPAVNPQPLALVAATIAPKLERVLSPPVPPVLPRITTPAPVVTAPPAPPPAPAEPGKLFLLVERIEAAIARKKLDAVRTRGAIALAAGFGMRCIDRDTPDDTTMQAKLEAAALAVLGEKP
jgi:predicted regulator of Ras-like GTPase activity (Roadblock/LC7/MglB family)